MQNVLVIDKNKVPLMPCHPARARELLRKGKAAVYKRFPFTLILKERTGSDSQGLELKLDPGSKTTGIALVADCKQGRKVVWAGELTHRGQAIRNSLLSRRQVRRGRRNRNTRYRQPRFLNRTRPKGWIAPSLKSRVDNVFAWAKRLLSVAPISEIAVETVRFDTQIMQNPEISGVEYQQGALVGYEVREYLLEKWGRKCAYCGIENVPLEVEHIVPRAKGGSNRTSNLTLSCTPCNSAKGTSNVKDFLAHDTKRLNKILAQAKAPLKDAAAINTIRYAIGNRLKEIGLMVSFWSGGRTKFNRTAQGLKKSHWLDAVCVGETGQNVHVPAGLQPLNISATGRGSRQMCRVDRYGFPRTSAKSQKVVNGFKTGDLVKAMVNKGKKIGIHIGRVAVRKSGSFNIKTKEGTVQGISWKYCSLLQRADGYNYNTGASVSSST